ncbi:MAG: ATP-dependent DNA helicase, partial [Planctomycetaceae bacterium]
MLLRSNAVDFDDLLMHVGRLVVESEEVRAELGEKFRYILVDEYQDTNFAQYKIACTLAHEHRNLCVTGDPDQSIYGWRGAEIGNILQFERDFPEARVVRLEQNYRSTQAICRAADALIAHNQRRKAKSLYTLNPEGTPVEPLFFDDQNLEAEGIATTIRGLSQAESRPWSHFAIFFRVNALSRAVELALGRNRIPYQVAAGLAFYERVEVKDLLGYLRLIHNPADRAAFQRVVNTPLRGIGKTTVTKLVGWADQQRITPLEAARDAGRFPGITKRAVTGLAKFSEMIDRLSKTPYGGVLPLFDDLLKFTGYGHGWDKSSDETDLQRAANIAELRTAAAQYDAANAADPTLEGFLENSSLVADLDGVD